MDMDASPAQSLVLFLLLWGENICSSHKNKNLANSGFHFAQSFLFNIARPSSGITCCVYGETSDQVLSTGPIFVMLAHQIPYAAMRGEKALVCALFRVPSFLRNANP